MKRLFPKHIPIFHRVDLGDTHFGKPPRLQHIVLLYAFIILVGLSFLILLLRLFQLTIVKGTYYRRLSEENRIREITIEPMRGKILDRKGFVLVENEKGNVETKKERIISPRVYLAREEMAHLLGYRQSADAQDLKNDSCINKLISGDKVGKKGIEKAYECELRGSAGKKLIEVDAHGNYLKTLTIIPPKDGDAIQLAIDHELQNKAYEAIKTKKAAVIGLKPATGEVLVFVSTPSFDPQKFEDGDVKVEDYFTDPTKPLFNRITEATYPPGSIFKLFVASGVLEEKKMTEDTIIEDNGSIKAGPLSFGNWYFLQYGKTDGPVDMVKAIRRSNDIYFYKAGEVLGPEGMKKWASVFGLSEKTNIGFDEAEGLIPSPFWKSEVLKERWYLGDTYNTAIGQGYTLLSPLQIARGVLPFANGGNLCQPTLLKNEDPKCKKLNISPKTFGIIHEGMKQACSPGGTGWPLFDFTASNSAGLKTKIQTGCKTGTAESHGKSGIPHAWFTVFAPFDNPEIMLTVLVEEGGQGSDVAGPIARDILKAYFERNQ